MSESFTDEEFAFLRHARFGELPDRIRPEDAVPTTETDPRRDRPEPDPYPEQLLPSHG